MLQKNLNLMLNQFLHKLYQEIDMLNFFQHLGIIASSIERFATEIRHLQRTEVLEVEEFFGKKQKGSSAMPHKKNPILK